ncbi:MAG: methyltransferase domain-containing protein [Nitrospirota bacterium]|nr:methyltransferase domain-containing protein [Nitrospirota bacterium]
MNRSKTGGTRRVGSRARTLGPVPDLEAHVRGDWWRKIFNPLYLKTDGDVVGDAEITRREVGRIIELLNLAPESRVLDLCCGQGRHTLELARRGIVGVEGLDRSHYLIQKARDQGRKEGLRIRFREGDARRLGFQSDRFDAVLILGNSFGYFESLQDDLAVLREVMRVLKPWGKILIDIADGDYLRSHFQPRSWEWIDSKLFVCRERSLTDDSDRLVSREVVTHVEKGVLADQFYAERLYSRDAIQRLLERAGFTDAAFPDVAVRTESQRDQDLGMMAQRNIAVAVVRKEWSAVRKPVSQGVRHVAVVMGDPERPDPLKPLTVFDEDDFYTIDRMKEALAEREGYKFTYLQNHGTLIQDLGRLAGRVDYVFNLCDEGFSNDARRELHVPALLEMLGIPYSGSNPQCLAYCYDKSLVRGIAKEMGLPTPSGVFLQAEDMAYDLPFPFPAIVKPNFGDSSFGITTKSVVYTPEELIDQVRTIRDRFGYEKPVLVEEFLTGKDLTVGIIGTPPAGYTVLPVLEEDYTGLPDGLPRICGYEAKWVPDSPYSVLRSVPANLPIETEQALVEWCVGLAERLECRDYTRIDWRLDASGVPRLLEVNPNPGWCWDGHLAKMAGLAGMRYTDMLGAILRTTEDRLGLTPQEVQAATTSASGGA